MTTIPLLPAPVKLLVRDAARSAGRARQAGAKRITAKTLDLLLDLNFAFRPTIGTDEWEISYTGLQTLYHGLVKHGLIKENTIKFYQSLTKFTGFFQDAN
jgi:hypothetical protein